MFKVYEMQINSNLFPICHKMSTNACTYNRKMMLKKGHNFRLCENITSLHHEFNNADKHKNLVPKCSAYLQLQEY